MVSVPVAESKDHVAVVPHFPDVLDAANTVAGSSVNVNINAKNKLHILLLIFFPPKHYCISYTDIEFILS